MNRKYLLIIGIVLLLLTVGAGYIVLSDDSSSNTNETEQRDGEGPTVDERGEDGEETIEEGDSEEDEEQLDTIDYPDGASESSLDWELIVNNHYEYMRTNHNSMHETVEYRDVYDKTVETNNSTVGGHQSLDMYSKHDWQNKQFHLNIDEELDQPDREESREIEKFLENSKEYERVNENGNSTTTVSDQDYVFSRGTSKQILFMINLDFHATGVENVDGEQVIVYEASFEDNQDNTETSSESLKRIDTEVYLTENGQIVRMDHRVEMDVDVSDEESTTRVETMTYEYNDINSVDISRPQWVENEMN